jgi:hypothetical protein
VREKPKFGFPFYGVFPSDCIPKARKYVISVFTVAFPVNYTNEFWENFEVTTCYNTYSG